MNQTEIEKKDTPSSEWYANGEPDPHGMRYVGKRRCDLAIGKLSDDALANGAFMYYDQPLDLAGILAGTAYSPVGWMTAVKDRIRWLSRMFEKSEREKAELRERLAEKTAEATELHERVKFLEEKVNII